jgi:hypothetical protein
MSPDAQDARVRFQHEPLPADANRVRAALLRFLRDRIGWPELGACQDETLRVTSFDAVPVEGGHGGPPHGNPAWRVRFVYVFDHDTASQYDLTDAFRGDVLLDAGLEPLSGTLEPR